MFAPACRWRSLLLIPAFSLGWVPALAAQEQGSGVREVPLPELRAAAQEGLSALELIRRDVAEVRFRQIPPPAGMEAATECLEYVETQGDCSNVDVVVDGVLLPEPLEVLRFMDLDPVARLEVLAPASALVRYGNFGERGVILIETRATVAAAPESTLEVAESYPWTRVLASTFVTNALAVGLTYLPLSYCTHVWDGSLQIRELREPGQLRDGLRCNEALAIGSGFLALGAPGPVSGLVARRMGATPDSRGTLVSVTVGTLLHLAGHTLFFKGRADDSTFLTAAGAGILTLGTPLAVTLVDRFSRRPR